MKSLLLRMSAVIIAIAAASAVTFAQTPKRIDMDKDGPAAVFEQSVAGNSSKSFVVRLVKGQHVRIMYIEDTKQGTVDFGKETIEEGLDVGLDFDVEVTKDYSLVLSNPNNKSTNFRVFITIGNDPEQNMPEAEAEEIPLGKADTASISRSVQPGQSLPFTFQGQKGVYANLKVIDRSNTLEAMLDGGVLATNDVIPSMMDRTGDHLISIYNPGKRAQTFTIEVSFEQPDTPAADSEDFKFEEETVKFARGSTQAEINQTLGAGVSKMFLFRAKKGQTLRFVVDDETNKLEVDFNKYRRQLNKETVQVLNSSGDWAIYVNNPTKKAVGYTLWIAIE